MVRLNYKRIEFGLEQCSCYGLSFLGASRMSLVLPQLSCDKTTASSLILWMNRRC